MGSTRLATMHAKAWRRRHAAAWLGAHCKQQCAGLQVARGSVASFARSLGQSYSSYVMQTPPHWLQAVDSNAVRQVNHHLISQIMLLDE